MSFRPGDASVECALLCHHNGVSVLGMYLHRGRPRHDSERHYDLRTHNGADACTQVGTADHCNTSSAFIKCSREHLLYEIHLEQ